MTVGAWVRLAAEKLAEAGVEASRLEAQLLIAHALNTDRTAVLTHPEATVPTGVEALLERRLAGEPLAYILGYREFYSRRFAVNPSVLIPRQETETLVEAALERAPKGARVLDVGTGSGCIAITLKLDRPDLGVEAVDISEAALETARGNAKQLDADVKFGLSDIFGNVPGEFDLIISNPPYVAEAAELPIEIRQYEPSHALFAGPDGLDFYRSIASTARSNLSSSGEIILEAGDGMMEAVRSVFEAERWKIKDVRLDIGGMPRCMVVSC